MRQLRFRPALFVICVVAASTRLHAQSLHEDAERKWFRGNMHTHSLWSDGDDYPEMIASWYKANGYQFLVFTDHNVLLQGERWSNIDSNKGQTSGLRRTRSAIRSTMGRNTLNRRSGRSTSEDV